MENKNIMIPLTPAGSVDFDALFLVLLSRAEECFSDVISEEESGIHTWL